MAGERPRKRVMPDWLLADFGCSSIRRSTMKRYRALSFGLWLGLTLMPGLAIMPDPMMAAGETLIVGAWEGTLDPGAQAKKPILVHISTGGGRRLTGPAPLPSQSISGIGITAITYKE